jgi:hypothetical protein
MAIKKITVNENNIENMNSEEAYERQYYENSIIIKIKDGLVDDIATCFSIEDTMQYLSMAPLEFISRTEGTENEKEFKTRLWKEVNNFYNSAKSILYKR